MFADGQLNFHFPLFTTSMHMIVQFILASLILVFFPSVRPGQDYTDSASSSPVRDENSRSGLMTPHFYITRIAPCATATGLDIGLGNTSLRFVTLIFFSKSRTFPLVQVYISTDATQPCANRQPWDLFSALQSSSGSRKPLGNWPALLEL